MDSRETEFGGIGNDAVVLVSAGHNIGRIGSWVFNPFPIDSRMRQSFGQDDILYHVHQSRAVGTSPQGDGRTDKIDSRNRLHIDMVRNIGRHIGYQGIMNLTAFRTVARLIIQKDTSQTIDHRGISVHDAVIRFFIGIESDVADTVSAQCKHLSFMQAIRQRETFRVGRVNDILEWSRIPFYIGGTANGIVVEGKHTDAVIDYIAGIAGHSDDFAQQVVDIGIIGTPLDAVDAIPGFEAVQGQFEIFIGRLQGYRCYRTVRVFEGKAISLCIINGLLGRIIHFLFTIIERQQRRGFVGRTELAVRGDSRILHTRDIPLVVNADTEIIGLKIPCLFGRTTEKRQGYSQERETFLTHIIHIRYHINLFSFYSLPFYRPLPSPCLSIAGKRYHPEGGKPVPHSRQRLLRWRHRQ